MEDIQIIEKAIRENKFIEFIYHDTRRIVAPYRLEELKNGVLVLSGLREGGDTLRAFKLDEIAGIDLLNKTFDSSIFHKFALSAGKQSKPTAEKKSFLSPVTTFVNGIVGKIRKSK